MGHNDDEPEAQYGYVPSAAALEFAEAQYPDEFEPQDGEIKKTSHAADRAVAAYCFDNLMQKSDTFCVPHGLHNKYCAECFKLANFDFFMAGVLAAMRGVQRRIILSDRLKKHYQDEFEDFCKRKIED